MRMARHAGHAQATCNDTKAAQFARLRTVMAPYITIRHQMHGMRKRLIVAVGLIAGMVAAGWGANAWAVLLEARIDPYDTESRFKVTYLKTYSIWYPDGGMIADELRGQNTFISEEYNFRHPDVQSLIERLNERIVSSGSQARISDMKVSYSFGLSGGQDGATIDYKIILNGHITDYNITKYAQRTLVDLGWRGLSVDGGVTMGEHEINDPFAFVEANAPVTAGVISGTAADRIFDAYLINADAVLEKPLERWRFLLDPTHCNVDARSDAGPYSLSSSIYVCVLSDWTMDESILREEQQVEIVEEEVIVADREYMIRSAQAPNQGHLSIIGFGVIDTLEGVDIAGVTPNVPPPAPPTDDFPTFMMYGMAGLAAAAGIAFFIHNRLLKNKQG